MSKKILRILLTLVLITLIWRGVDFIMDRISSKSVNKRRCEVDEKNQKIEINGILINKYLDKYARQKLLILNKNGDTVISNILFLEHSRIFDKLEKGDIINKKENSFVIKISRRDSIFNDTLNYGCLN